LFPTEWNPFRVVFQILEEMFGYGEAQQERIIGRKIKIYLFLKKKIVEINMELFFKKIYIKM